MHKTEKTILQSLKRRKFLNVTGGAALAALAGSEPRRLSAAKTLEKIEPTADTMILIWMAGGMAQTETWDPKAYTPFEPGIESKRVLSTFPKIDTAVDDIKLSKGLENVGKVMDRGALVRSYRSGDLGFILHARHQFHWHTGYAPPLSVAAPHIGSVVSRTLGPLNPDVPAFIDIGQNLEIGAEADSLKSFHTAGFLGSEYGPFLIRDPREAAASVRPPGNVTPERFRRRWESFRALQDANPVMRHGSSFQQESLLRSLENGYRLLSSPSAKAFDLSLEPKENIEKYGDNRFGLGCLLARRLTEAGARFVEVTSEYIPFRFWDTHENGHTRARDMKAVIDRPISQLVLDLEERGLLDRTLIVIASEFGRDMITEGRPGALVKDQIKQPDVIQELKHYGMHRHFTESSSVVLFGGGVKKGLLYGLTAEERPCSIINGAIGIEDLHATLLHAMGIAPDTAYDVEQRPFYATKDGKGKARMELFG